MKKILILLIAVLLLAGCGGSEQENKTGKDGYSGEAESASRDFFAMDTYMSVLAYGPEAENAVEEAVREVNRLDSLLSAGDEDSEVGSINRNGNGKLSDDGKMLLKESLSLYEETGGCFDITVYPLVELWGFVGQEYRLPSDVEIRETLPLIGADAVKYNEKDGEISFAKEGMKIDFGGIAKGYTSARIISVFQKNGVESALVSLGGNVQALGSKPDGNPWRIGIRDPKDTSSMIGVLSVTDRAVITSGGYERYFEENGKRYHHILDPKTGYPAESGLSSVTIVCRDGTYADGLSTSLFIMGKERASAFWRERSDRFDAVMVTEDGKICVTEGLRDSFASALPFEIITGS